MRKYSLISQFIREAVYKPNDMGPKLLNIAKPFSGNLDHGLSIDNHVRLNKGIAGCKITPTHWLQLGRGEVMSIHNCPISTPEEVLEVQLQFELEVEVAMHSRYSHHSARR